MEPVVKLPTFVIFKLPVQVDSAKFSTFVIERLVLTDDVLEKERFPVLSIAINPTPLPAKEFIRKFFQSNFVLPRYLSVQLDVSHKIAWLPNSSSKRREDKSKEAVPLESIRVLIHFGTEEEICSTCPLEPDASLAAVDPLL